MNPKILDPISGKWLKVIKVSSVNSKRSALGSENSMEPYVIQEDNKFCFFCKPPYYIMDTSRDYTSLDADYIKKMYKTSRKPFLMYVKDYLIKNYKTHPGPPQYNACQRLDINTSGIVLVAKKNEYWETCRKIINNKDNTVKIYVCLVNGRIKNKKGYIYLNIKCGGIPVYCTTEEFDKEATGSMYSYSYYQVYREYEREGKVYSLVYVRIFTGRTHQIRVHMKSLGTTIVSDDLYTDESVREKNKELVERMFLHNIYLGFSHENTNYSVQLRLLPDLVKCLKRLRVREKFKIDYSVFGNIQRLRLTATSSRVRRLRPPAFGT